MNVLGANVAKQCLEARLLDEVLVLIALALLGDGIRLFDRPEGTNVRLSRSTHAGRRRKEPVVPRGRRQGRLAVS